MFVYGIQCPVNVIASLPPGIVDADYYMEYGILVFREYSKPSFLQNYRASSGALATNTTFNTLCKSISENKTVVAKLELEHPYITEAQDTTVWKIKDQMPSTDLAWFHVPHVVPTGV